MTFQTETVLSCSVPPSSRGFERLNTEKPSDLQRDPCRSHAVSKGAHALGHQPVGDWIRMESTRLGNNQTWVYSPSGVEPAASEDPSRLSGTSTNYVGVRNGQRYVKWRIPIFPTGTCG
jgi:hypothetical protein